MAATAYVRLVRASGNSSSMRGGGTPVPDCVAYNGLAATPITVDATHEIADIEVPYTGVLPSDLLFEVTLRGADGEDALCSFGLDPDAENDTDLAVAFVGRPNHFAVPKDGQGFRVSLVAAP
jgi:hypothetical protein